MKIDRPRQDILDHVGHLLIEGGPGCGKTTIALLKARRAMDGLEREQRVLFLSFSRAAVRQILDRSGQVFGGASKVDLEVRTFHAFFQEVVRSHGWMLNRRAPRFVTPDREQHLKADFDGPWRDEADRMAREEGRYVFDSLASTAAELFERSEALCRLYSDRYPMLIVDEFQDTNTDQWRAVKALAQHSVLICLADSDQRIFDHLDGIDSNRVAEAIAYLDAQVFDLSSDNYRSPGGGLLDYANAVLKRTGMRPPAGVGVLTYRGAQYDAHAHYALVHMREVLLAELGRQPTIAMLGRNKSIVGRLSEVVSTPTKLPKRVLPAVEHELQWDAHLSAAAGYVVGSILEWPGGSKVPCLQKTIQHLTDFYRVKVANGVKGGKSKIQVLDRAVEALGLGANLRSKAVDQLAQAFDRGLALTGDPVRDWQTARACLSGAGELTEVFREVRLLRLFNATDALAWGLIDAWDGSAYIDGAGVVRRVLANESLSGSAQEPALVNFMNMHKSKGKEFDGVVIVEGLHSARLLRPEWDETQMSAERRLLRVAITRARHGVIFVRPQDAMDLTM